MGILSNLFKSKASEPIQDELFGTLKRINRLFLSTRVNFAPVGKDIEIIIESEGSPPEEQREFYREIEAKYAVLSKEIGDALYDEYTNAYERILRDEIWTKFQLESIDIPSSRENGWQLSYYLNEGPGYTFNVHMKNFVAQGISIDR